MDRERNLCPVRLTAAMVRGTTNLRVRIDEEISCVCVDLDGAPYPIVLGVTPTGAENLHAAIAAGLADLAIRQSSQTATDD